MVLNSLSERETCVQAASLAALTGPNSPVTLQALKSRALQLGANQEQVNELDSAQLPWSWWSPLLPTSQSAPRLPGLSCPLPRNSVTS